MTFKPLTVEQATAAVPGLPVWPAALPNHLSASQITMFQRCPEQYRRRYLLGEKARPGAALIWGSADHYAHEQNFGQKITTGTDIPEEDVKLAFAEGFDRAVDRNGGQSEIEWDEKPGTLKDKGVALVGVYHQQVSPRIQPVAVEEKFTIHIPQVPVPVIGYVDVVTEAVGIERKTAGRKESVPKPDWRIQGLIYQAVKRMPVEWHISAKTKVPGVYTAVEEPRLLLPLNHATVDATLQLMQTVAKAITGYHNLYGPDDPWPGAITHPWACGYCGYRPTCPWWAGENAVPVPADMPPLVIAAEVGEAEPLFAASGYDFAGRAAEAQARRSAR